MWTHDRKAMSELGEDSHTFLTRVHMNATYDQCVYRDNLRKNKLDLG